MIKRRKYLYRLAVSIFGILLAPMILFTVFFWKQSYHELLDSNDAYYEKVIDSYKMILDKKITNLRSHAINISVQSKEPDNLFFGRETQAPYENYWYYNAMKELWGSYNDHGVSGIGIYYYDVDTVVKTSGVMTLEQYIRMLAPDRAEEVWDFFSEEAYDDYGMQLLVSDSENILLGFHVNMGYIHEKVMIFYQISESDLEAELGAAYEGSGFSCYLTDDKGNTFFIGEEKALDTEKTICFSEDGYEVYTLGGCLSEDVPQNRATVFFHEIGILIIFMVIIMLVSYVVILYIAYKPVYNVTSKLLLSDGDEFEVLSRELEDKSTRIAEQEMLILDFLLNYLLYGIPIPEGRIKHLGVTEKMQYFCVFLLEGYVLINAQEKELTLQAREKYHAKMFVTDWQGKKQSVFIVLMEENNVEKIRELICTLCVKNNISEDALYGGKVVNALDNISDSLQQCFKEMKSKTGETRNDDKSKAQKQEKLKKDILEYVEANYRDADLSQECLADHFAISTYTLSRMFRNKIGIGFVEYINAKRVEYAKEQLLTTSVTVHEIAIKSGFSSDNNFFKVFKAYTGVSPSAFREQ